MASNIDVSVPTPVRATTRSVRDNFVAAKDEIEALQTENVQQGDRLDTLEQDVAAGPDTSALETRITANEGDIADLQTDVGQNATDISDNANEITTLDGRVTTNETDIATLDGKVTTNETNIATNKSDIAALDTRVTTNKTNIETNQDEIEDHETRILGLEARPIGGGGTSGGVPEPNVIDAPELEDVALVRETSKVANPNYDDQDPDSKEFLNQGIWRKIKTGDIETDPDATFAVDPDDPKYDGLDNQLLVNRFFAEEIEGVGSVDISDSPPSDNKEGDLWFDNEEDVMQLAIFHEGSDAWVPVAPPTTIVERVTKGESTQLAIIDQIEESLTKQSQMDTVINNIADAVPNKIDKTGINDLPKDTDWRLRQLNSEDKNKTLMKISGGQLGLFNLQEPGESHHATPKSYVDTKVSEVGGGIDGKVEEAELKIGYNMHANWKYMGDSHQADNLSPGEFTIRTEGSVMKIYLAGTDVHNRKWYAQSANGESFTHAFAFGYGSITDRDGEVRKGGKLTEATFNNSGNNYARLKLEYYKSNFALTNGNYYTINAPGLLPHPHYMDHYEYNPSPRMVGQAASIKEIETAEVVIGLPMEEEE